MFTNCKSSRANARASQLVVLKLEVKRCAELARTTYVGSSKNQPITPWSRYHPFEPFPNTTDKEK
jgi:hypothetical protein